MEVTPTAWNAAKLAVCLLAPLLWLSPSIRKGLLRQFSTFSARLVSLFEDKDAIEEAKDDQGGDQGSWSVLWLVMELSMPELRLIILATFASLASSVSELLSPILLGYAMDTAVNRSTLPSVDDLLFLFGGIFGLEILTGSCEYIRHGTNNDIGDFIRQRARGMLFSSVLHQDQSFLDQTHSSTFNQRYNALDELHGLTGHLLPDLAGSILSLVATGVYLVNKNLILGFLVLLIFSIQGLVQSITERYRGSLFKKLVAFEQDCSAFREESWSSVKTIKSFRAEDRQSRSFDEQLDGDRVIRCALVRSHAAHECTGYLMSSLSSNLVWLVGLMSLILTQEGNSNNSGSLILNLVGFKSLGELSAFLIIVTKIRGAANRFLRAMSGLSKASSKLHQSLDLIHREPRMVHGTKNLPLLNSDDQSKMPPSLRVDFKDVHFAYVSRPDIEVLTGLSLTLAAGHVTALCGPSGGGKSTISALTLRLYDPTKGQVLFNGLNLKDLSNKALSGLMSIVSQEPILFSDTIESNIKFGKKEATDQQVMDATLAANCHEFISGFTHGYQTQVGEKGVRLSGGQKQRIAIARALLCNPSLLILDEASSALDAESEHLVQEATERVMAGRTVMVVAHRLSTIRLADKIVVISQGKAVEGGRHEELLRNKKGIYHQLIQRQLKG
jgi:ABC-type multidrug transport system fused ATPase/permease subunit